MQARLTQSFSDERYRGAFRITALYLLLSSLWILFSDRLLLLLVPDESTFAVYSVLKGWGYILVSAVLLYWLIRRNTDALGASEARLRSMVDSVSEVVWLKDLDGRFLMVNRHMEQMMGLGQHELLGRADHDLFPQAAADSYAANDRLVIEAGRELEFEEIRDLPDGRHTFAALKFPLLDRTGRVYALGAICTDITRRKQSEIALSHRTDELQMLYESGLALSQSLSPQEIAQRIIGLMDRKLDWHHTTIRLYHPENQSLELLAFHQPSVTGAAEERAVGERFQSLINHAGQGLSGWVVQNGHSVRVDDLSSDPRYVETAPGLRSGLYVPLRIGQRIIGVISIESEQPGAFTEADERLTSTLAAQAAIALENARLYAETIRQLEHLQALHAVDQAITTSLDLRVTLDVLLGHVTHQLGVDAADVLLFNPISHSLECARGHGFRSQPVDGVSVPFGGSFAGQAVSSRGIVQVLDSETAATVPAFHKLWTSEGFEAYYGVPLLAKGEVKGVLEVFLRASHSARPEWIGLLETLAGQAAISVDNTQLFERLQRANIELAIAYDATIEGWSRAMDLRDEEAVGHTQRVTDMTMALARALRVEDAERMYIRRGALLHDIGKIGVPDGILSKAGKLTEDEWALVRRHPQFAYDMLYPIAYLRPSIDIPHCHHEKWDGSGYPQGLRGEQIPLAARIFALADVWDALTTERPYRRAWTPGVALDYIREQSGKHFDPRIVPVFVSELGNR